MHVIHAIDAISERIIFILLYLELNIIGAEQSTSGICGNIEEDHARRTREGVRIQKSGVRRRTRHDGPRTTEGVRIQESGVRS